MIELLVALADEVPHVGAQPLMLERPADDDQQFGLELTLIKLLSGGRYRPERWQPADSMVWAKVWSALPRSQASLASRIFRVFFTDAITLA